jgi:hypothetical protein
MYTQTLTCYSALVRQHLLQAHLALHRPRHQGEDEVQ